MNTNDEKTLEQNAARRKAITEVPALNAKDKSLPIDLELDETKARKPTTKFAALFAIF